MKHRHSVTDSPGEVVGIAAIAAAVGAFSAMLFTPRTGGQVRRGLKRRADHAVGDLEHRLKSTKAVTDDVAEDAKQRVTSTAARVKSDTKSTSAKVKRDATATKRNATAAARRTRTPRS